MPNLSVIKHRKKLIAFVALSIIVTAVAINIGVTNALLFLAIGTIGIVVF